MGDDDERDAVLAVQLEEQALHAFARHGVEVAGRLVGEHGARLLHEGARHRHPLLLAAGELARPVVEALGEADPRRAGPSRAGARFQAPSPAIRAGIMTFSRAVKSGKR